MHAWSIPGSDGQPIIGDTHVPSRGESRGAIVICHGFKGYKDYGMLPRIARECADRAGLSAIRFNFSHSGMTRNIATFERPDLFERDTWSRQVFDLTAVLQAMARGDVGVASVPGTGVPGFSRVYLLGQSRGGVTAMLAAARLTYLGGLPDSADRRSQIGDRDGLASPRMDGVITLAAPSTCNPFTHDEQRALLEQGWLESPSSRTGQRLRVGRAFLQEQLDDPQSHDVLAAIGHIRCPMLVIHGERDSTVPARCAHEIIAAAASRGQERRATLRVIADADHVFNTTNPLEDSEPASRELSQVIDEIVAFTTRDS